MAFSQFKSIDETARHFDLTSKLASLLPLGALQSASQVLREKVDIVLQESLHRVSEAARCDMLIAPMLYELWLQHRSILKLWSHAPIAYSETLFGTPDYVIAAQSPFGSESIGTPILIAVEAKKDDFVLGWGQCAAEMLAAQKLNKNVETRVWGIVTNGESWEFGMLEKSVFTRHPYPYSIGDLDKLFGALSFIMEECVKQVTKPHLEEL
jgi:hypothetical protein